MTEPQNEAPKRPVAKEKLRSIMEAASALTALGDEESEGSRPSSPKEEKQEDHKEVDSSEIKEQEDGNPPKRYLPEHKKPDAAPTFPEKVSLTLSCDHGGSVTFSGCSGHLGPGTVSTQFYD